MDIWMFYSELKHLFQMLDADRKWNLKEGNAFILWKATQTRVEPCLLTAALPFTTGEQIFTLVRITLTESRSRLWSKHRRRRDIDALFVIKMSWHDTYHSSMRSTGTAVTKGNQSPTAMVIVLGGASCRRSMDLLSRHH